MSFSMCGTLDLHLEKVIELLLYTIPKVLRYRKKRAEEKRRKWEYVFEALAHHPILEKMLVERENNGAKWEELDYYCRYVPSSEFDRIFTITSTSIKADIGRKARIMMLTMWIIVHSLPSDMDIGSLISGAVEDGISAQLRDKEDAQSEPPKYEEVLQEMRRTFKRRLPLAIRNQLYGVMPLGGNGRDYGYFAEEFRKVIFTPHRRREIRTAALPNGNHRIVELAEQPSCLLVKTGGIIAPMDESTERVMLWFLKKLHVGKPVSDLRDRSDDVWCNIYLPELVKSKYAQPSNSRQQTLPSSRSSENLLASHVNSNSVYSPEVADSDIVQRIVKSVDDNIIDMSRANQKLFVFIGGSHNILTGLGSVV